MHYWNWLYQRNKAYEKKKYYILSLLAIFSIAIGVWSIIHIYFSSDPPIEESATTNPEDYLQVNHFIRRLLKINYNHLLPGKIPQECTPEYQYSYKCDFDGCLYFSIYLELRFGSSDDYLAEVSSIKKRIPDAIVKCKQEKQYYICKLEGIDHYFDNSERYYSGYSAAFIEEDTSEKKIKYLIIEQYSNSNQLSDNVNEMLGNLSDLR